MAVYSAGAALTPDFRITCLSGIRALNIIKKGRMKMKRKRRQFSDKFKVKVAMEAIKGSKTLAELSSDYKVHPNQISAWKKQLITNARGFFHQEKSGSQRARMRSWLHFTRRSGN